MGADCSGVTTAIANNVAIPNGVVMVSPSATSPALTTIEDDGYFFRTAPSDARQGEILAAIVKEQGLDNVAITYTNNDYGKGFADAFAAAFQALGGTVAINAPHEDGKADYSAEVAALQASGAPALVVLGYVDQGGVGIVQASLDTGAFESFFFGDGMYGQSLIDSIGDEINGKVIGTLPGTDGEGAEKFAELAKAAGMDPTGTYVPESYDAAALIALAIAAAGSADRTGIRDKMMDVANAPGEQIFAGELAKGLELAAAGTDIDYQGATGVELIGPGEAAGLLPRLRDRGQRRRTRSSSADRTRRRGRPSGPAAARGAAMIRVEDLHMHFGGIRAVDGASIEIAKGSITGLIGPNGAGKSTLFNVIAGHYKPTSGQVWLGERGDHRARRRTSSSTRGCCAPSRSRTSSRR